MTTMTGVVEQLATKDVTTKFGVKPTYSLKVNGSWVKHGFKNPMVSVGDEIQFDGTSGIYGMEATDIKVISKGAIPLPLTGGAPGDSKPAPAAFSGSYSKVFPIPPLHGDRSIVRQNALARATDLMIHAAGGKPYEVSNKVVDYIIKVAKRLEAYTSGDLDLAEAKAEMAADATVVLSEEAA